MSQLPPVDKFPDLPRDSPSKEGHDSSSKHLLHTPHPHIDSTPIASQALAGVSSGQSGETAMQCKGMNEMMNVALDQHPTIAKSLRLSEDTSEQVKPDEINVKSQLVSSAGVVPEPQHVAHVHIGYVASPPLPHVAAEILPRKLGLFPAEKAAEIAPPSAALVKSATALSVRGRGVGGVKRGAGGVGRDVDMPQGELEKEVEDKVLETKCGARGKNKHGGAEKGRRSRLPRGKVGSSEADVDVASTRAHEHTRHAPGLTSLQGDAASKDAKEFRDLNIKVVCEKKKPHSQKFDEKDELNKSSSSEEEDVDDGESALDEDKGTGGCLGTAEAAQEAAHESDAVEYFRYAPGDLVLVSTENLVRKRGKKWKQAYTIKSAAKVIGPFEVLSVKEDNRTGAHGKYAHLYKLKLPQEHVKLDTPFVHASALQIFMTKVDKLSRLPPKTAMTRTINRFEKNEGVYIVEWVLDMEERQVDGMKKKFALVAWEGEHPEAEKYTW